MADERISLAEAARRSGVSASTLKRWAEEKVVPVRRGRWTAAAAAQARVVARMRESGHSLEELKRAGREARRYCALVLAAGFALVAFLQIVRVYVRSVRRIADAEVRLFHLYVHEPLI